MEEVRGKPGYRRKASWVPQGSPWVILTPIHACILGAGHHYPGPQAPLNTGFPDPGPQPSPAAPSPSVQCPVQGREKTLEYGAPCWGWRGGGTGTEKENRGVKGLGTVLTLVWRSKVPTWHLITEPSSWPSRSLLSRRIWTESRASLSPPSEEVELSLQKGLSQQRAGENNQVSRTSSQDLHIRL